MKRTLIYLAILGAVAFTNTAHADVRKASTVTAFRKANPCPATGKVATSCKGWVVNHIVPLCYGGPDTVANLEWEQTAASYKRDVFERALCRKQATDAVKKVGGVTG